MSRAQHDKLVEAFRERENISRAARIAEVPKYSATQAWRTGWPEGPLWSRVAIRDIVADDQVDARTKVLEETPKLVEKRKVARVNAIDERARAGQGAVAAMYAGIGQLAGAQSLTQELAKKIAAHTAQEVMREIAAGNVNMDKGLRLLQQIARFVKDATAQFRDSVDVLWKVLGEPDSKIEVSGQTTVVHDLDADSAVSILGSEAAVRQALKDVAAGIMTEDARRLLEHKVEKISMH